MALQKLDETIVEDVEDDSAEEVVEYAITSYGADFTIDSLVSRLQRGDIFVPSFQREFVWDGKMASKFVESLLLGLPVPGIFLSKEEETKRLMVVDGQQRLKSLLSFYEGKFAEKKFVLTGQWILDSKEKLMIHLIPKIAAHLTIPFCMRPSSAKISLRMTTAAFIRSLSD